MPTSDHQHENDPVIVHLHWTAFVSDLSILVVSVVVPPAIAFFLLPSLLSADTAGFVRRILPLCGVLWALAVWMMVTLIWMRYYLSLWIVTDKYLVYVNQVSFFSRQVASWDMAAIQDATTNTDDPLESWLDYGTIWVKTPEAGESEFIVATPIPHPETMRTAILKYLPKKIAQETPEDTSQTQEELIRSISHEMKGHLTRSQVTFASIVAGDFGEVPENLKNVAGAALADTREGVETVMNILNSANLKKGTLSFDKERFDLLATVRESVDRLRSDAQRKGIILRFKDHEGTCFIDGDRQKLLHHVMRNLIDNSIRYTPAGSIDVDLTWDDAVATLSVTDTGVGISPRDMQHLFTEGGKGAHSTNVNPQSTGYGLFVAKMVVEGHGGKIWAESDGPGLGSRFITQLPVHATTPYPNV